MRYHHDDARAFPLAALDGDGQPYAMQPGMNLRDYFAAKAMAVLLHSLMEQCKTGEPPTDEQWDKLCSSAYEIADTMIAEREE